MGTVTISALTATTINAPTISSVGTLSLYATGNPLINFNTNTAGTGLSFYDQDNFANALTLSATQATFAGNVIAANGFSTTTGSYNTSSGQFGGEAIATYNTSVGNTFGPSQFGGPSSGYYTPGAIGFLNVQGSGTVTGTTYPLASFTRGTTDGLQIAYTHNATASLRTASLQTYNTNLGVAGGRLALQTSGGTILLNNLFTLGETANTLAGNSGALLNLANTTDATSTVGSFVT